MCAKKDETKSKVNELIAAMDRLTQALQPRAPVDQDNRPAR
jgi:hypothetical protein